MTDHTYGTYVPEGNPLQEPARLQSSKVRISNQIGRFLSIAVILFALTSVGFAYWITREHNRLADTSSEQMIRGGFSTLEDTLKTITMDYAIWPEAVNAINGEEIGWLWDNIGVSAAVTETTDLMLIVPPHDAEPYGWIPGMDETPKSGLLAPEYLRLVNRLLDEVDKSERRAISTIIQNGDEVWLLSSARVVSDDPAEDPADDGAIPRLVFGYHLDEDLIQDVGREYLIDDLVLSNDLDDEHSAFALEDLAGQSVAYAVWTPPRPGDQILRQIAVPLAIALAVLTVVALISSSLLSRSARRLESTMLTAQAASRAKTDFIANISHELRTPMNGIIGLATLLQQSDMGDRQNKMIKMLLGSARTQMGLIGDLLDISSIENGHFNLTLAPFDPKDVVEDVVGLFEIEAKDKNLELRLEISSENDLDIIGDKERFRQICSNLISNATKFTDEGHVAVTLTCRSRLDDAVVELTVTDTGPGIKPADQARIFERFAQGGTQRTGKATGTGLGLSITKTIVDLMGGEIALKSQTGKGSTFTATIPFEIAAKEIAPAE